MNAASYGDPSVDGDRAYMSKKLISVNLSVSVFCEWAPVLREFSLSCHPSHTLSLSDKESFMNKKFTVVREVWLGLALTAFSAFFLQQTSTINKRAQQYPRIILTVLLILSLALLIQGIYYSFHYENYLKRYGKSTKSIEWGVVTHPLLVFGLTVLYLALFHFINFFVATAIFVPLVMLLFGERKVLPILLTTVGLEVFVYFVFVRLLHVYFPM